jgi:hypothetical protein
MIERAIPQAEPPVPLGVAAGQRIVTPGLDPVFGWLGAESARIAQPLILPQALLEPRASTSISYACNLPASWAGCGVPQAQSPQQASDFPGVIAREGERSFLQASLPGGQVPIALTDGSRAAIAFRWACVTAHASIGAVWRCFLKLNTPLQPGLWTAAAHDYVFEASGGWLLSAPGILKVALGERSFQLTHLAGLLTCFPSHSGRVKTVCLRADGWCKRELKSLWLYPDRSIVARFSDGSAQPIATAAPGRTAAALAA